MRGSQSPQQVPYPRILRRTALVVPRFLLYSRWLLRLGVAVSCHVCCDSRSDGIVLSQVFTVAYLRGLISSRKLPPPRFCAQVSSFLCVGAGVVYCRALCIKSRVTEIRIRADFIAAVDASVRLIPCSFSFFMCC